MDTKRDKDYLEKILNKKNILKKKNILIVGGTGFIGYHLAISCVQKNFSVTCISTKIPTIKRRVKKVKYIRLDISNKKEVKRKLHKRMTM